MAIALDTKGPEIRTGILEGDDGRLELTLEKGATIKIVTDDAFKEKCTKDMLWVDYKNISKVLVPGNRIFIDDGLISVIAKECGNIFSKQCRKIRDKSLIFSTFCLEKLRSALKFWREKLFCGLFSRVKRV